MGRINDLNIAIGLIKKLNQKNTNKYLIKNLLTVISDISNTNYVELEPHLYPENIKFLKEIGMI